MVLGATQAWMSRHFANADGVSYLDVSDAYLRRDFSQIWNAYWSPMYSWVLAAARLVVRPRPETEYPLTHFVNFLSLCWALIAFRILLGEVRKLRFPRLESPRSEAAFVALAYAVFLWSSLALIGARVLTPDLMEAGFVYLAAAILVRAARGESTVSSSVALGVVLALGYFAKAPLFPVGFAFVATLALLPSWGLASLKRSGVALVAFLALSSAWIVPLSIHKGRLTFGDSGTLNYAWYVNDVRFRHWQGGPPGSGVPLHPTRAVMADPPIYQFGTPIKGTYPVWTDPSYWYDGVRIHFDAHRELVRIRANAKLYYRTFINPHLLQLLRDRHIGNACATLFVALLVVLLFERRKAIQRRGGWRLALPAIGAILMLTLVYVEPRHLAPYVALLLLLGLSASWPISDRRTRRLTTLCLIVVVASLGLVSIDVFRPAPADPSSLPPASLADVTSVGLRSGTRLASLDYSSNHLAWARMLRAEFVAEIYRDAYLAQERDFWSLAPSRKAEVLDAFRRAGASAVVARDAPPESEAQGWTRIPGTHSSVLGLR